jgi:hypothetical protein
VEFWGANGSIKKVQAEVQRAEHSQNIREVSVSESEPGQGKVYVLQGTLPPVERQPLYLRRLHVRVSWLGLAGLHHRQSGIHGQSTLDGRAVQETVELSKSSVYLRLVRTSISIFSNKVSQIRKGIANLEGLTVTTLDNLGFKLKHRNGLYQNQVDTLKTTALREKWLKKIAGFRESSIFDQYPKLKAIGSGNFFNFFRGKGKLY